MLFFWCKTKNGEECPKNIKAEQGNTKKQRSIAGMSLHTSKSDTSNDDEDDDDDGSTRDETESSHDD